MNSIPITSGIYGLVFHLLRKALITFDRKGSQHSFLPGWYLYVGSACGAGGLRGRLARHRRYIGDCKRFHWHVDYFREHATLCEIWYAETTDSKFEHLWAKTLSDLDGTTIPVPKFGASDCKTQCPSHFFHRSDRPSTATFRAKLASRDFSTKVFVEFIEEPQRTKATERGLEDEYLLGKRFLERRRRSISESGMDPVQWNSLAKRRPARRLAEQIAEQMRVSFWRLKCAIDFATAVETLVKNCGADVLQVLFDPSRPQGRKAIMSLSRTSDIRQRYRVDGVIRGLFRSVAPHSDDTVFDTVKFGESIAIAGMSRRLTGSAAEQSGCSLVGLAIRDETVGFGGRVVVTLGKRDRRLELPWTRLNVGSPVILSEEVETAEAVCRGIVTHRDRETITVAVAEAPEPVGERPLFRLDLSSDEISRQRQRDALRKAMGAERGPLAALKRCLLGEEPPVFAAPKPWTPLSTLDDSQRDAVRHALAAESVAIIHGPPGTGKTTTVVELIRQAVRRGERVLARAPSNLAVDNLLERLFAGGERAIRLGHPARVLPELREHTLDVLVETHPDLKLAREWTKEAWALRREASKYKRTAPPPGERRNLRAEAKQLLDDARRLESQLVSHLLDSAPIVCATLTGLNTELLGERVFDLVVIDEAAQATEPTCWIPLVRARRLVLAGDHCQLPPTVLSHEARKENFHVSLMQRLHTLCGAPISRRLTTQYRMHEQIMRFSSDTFYESSLIAAAAVRQHRLTDLPQATPCSLTQAVLKFYDTAGSSCDEQAEAEGASRENPGEAAFVAQHVAALVAAGVATTEIAVITPYAAQARRLRQLILDEGVEIDTVDGFQGREKEAVVISLVRSNPQGELGFLTDTRRMNVALTRARRSLTVFGDSSTLANHEFHVRLLEYFEHQEAYGTVWELGDAATSLQ